MTDRPIVLRQARLIPSMQKGAVMQVKFTRAMGRTKGGILSGGREVFQLDVIVVLTDEEKDLLNRHNYATKSVTIEAPTLKEYEDADREARPDMTTTYGQLVQGWRLQHRNVNVILEAEKSVLAECRHVIGNCHMLDTFKGEQERVVEVDVGGERLVAVA